MIPQTITTLWDTFVDPIDRELIEPLMEESLAFIPPIDVYHDDKNVFIRAEVPGCKREDLDVRIEGELLIFSGKKEHVPSEHYHQVESRCGTFERAITLSHIVDKEKLSATYENGVLTITMPLLTPVQPKKIPIKD